MGGRNGQILTMIAIVAAGAATGGLALAAAPAALGGAAAAGAGAAAAAGTTAAAAGTAFSITGALAGAATGFQIFSQIQQGQAESYAADVEKGQQELQLGVDQAQAAIAEAERQDQLRSMLGTQRAISGASSIGGNSLLAAKALGVVNRNTAIAAVNSDISEASALAGIGQSAYASRAARNGSYVKAGGSLLQFASNRADRAETLRR